MTHDERREVCDEVFVKVNQLLNGKGADYGSAVDANANFKHYEDMGMTRFQVWFLYVSKHWTAIRNAIINNPQHPKRNAEHLRESIIDVITYSVILLTLLDEIENNV